MEIKAGAYYRISYVFQDRLYEDSIVKGIGGKFILENGGKTMDIGKFKEIRHLSEVHIFDASDSYICEDKENHYISIIDAMDSEIIKLKGRIDKYHDSVHNSKDGMNDRYISFLKEIGELKENNADLYRRNFNLNAKLFANAMNDNAKSIENARVQIIEINKQLCESVIKKNTQMLKYYSSLFIVFGFLIVLFLFLILITIATK